MLRRPTFTLGLLAFVAVVIVVGALLGHVITAAGFAAFFVFISAIEGKPAWKAQYDPPGTQDSGRNSGRFQSWRRVGATSRDRIFNLKDD